MKYFGVSFKGYTLEREREREIYIYIYIYIYERDKSQSKQIQLTETVINDGVAKRDGLVALPTKELANGLITWTERQGDRWTP